MRQNASQKEQAISRDISGLAVDESGFSCSFLFLTLAGKAARREEFLSFSFAPT